MLQYSKKWILAAFVRLVGCFCLFKSEQQLSEKLNKQIWKQSFPNLHNSRVSPSWLDICSFNVRSGQKVRLWEWQQLLPHCSTLWNFRFLLFRNLIHKSHSQALKQLKTIRLKQILRKPRLTAFYLKHQVMCIPKHNNTMILVHIIQNLWNIEATKRQFCPN